MKLATVLDEAKFPELAKSIFLASKIENLHPPQAEAITKGVLQGKNLLMSVPTAAGKTLVAELSMIHALTSRGGRCLYIAPLKALASEKYNDFKNKYAPLGIEVGLAIGDIDSPSKYLNKYKIIVATAEKVDSLLRNKAKWLIDDLSVVVLDEIHFINDGLRGPTMEILIARIRQLNPNIQILGLSATIRNAREMADWLDAELVLSTWRPIPLKEGVFQNNRIEFKDHGTRMIYEEEAPDDVSKLTLDTLRGKGQVLIFVGSRRSAQAVSREVCGVVSKIISAEERKELLTLSKQILGSPGEATKVCHKLADTIKNGVAFHHAGLKPKQRELIEENFKKNLVKVIGCTPTLAAGVNLPARRAIIRDVKRFESGIGSVFIPTSEYKQCAGRAGRPQYDDYGEAVLIAKTASEASTLFERFILADPEPVTSKLADEASLRIHILSSIAGGYVYDINGMFDFIKHTFLHHQRLTPNLLEIISDIFDFLQQQGFVEKSGYRFFATPLGALTSRLYIDPMTVIILRQGLELVSEEKPLTAIGMLHLINCTPDVKGLNVGKKDMDDVEHFIHEHRDEFILTPENCSTIEDIYSFMATAKTAWMLNQWINEEKEDSICDQFGVGPGDIFRHVETTQWLLYAAINIAELIRQKSLTFAIDSLKNRMHYGIKEELLDLCQLKGVGRIRARNLFHHGVKSVNELRLKNVEEIEMIPTIGKALAKDIIAQANKSKMATTKTSPLIVAADEALVEEGWVD